MLINSIKNFLTIIRDALQVSSKELDREQLLQQQSEKMENCDIVFLTTQGVNHYLHELIKDASEFIYLITPYAKINQRLQELLKDKVKQGIQVRLICRKQDLKDSDESILLDCGVQIVNKKNLHAKCYINESQAIVSSLNLYDFSQVNNDEMGIWVNKENDIFKDILEESQRLANVDSTMYIDNIPENGGYNRSSLIGKTTKEYAINSDKTGNQWINYKSSIGGNTEIKIVKVSTVAGANFNPTWKNVEESQRLANVDTFLSSRNDSTNIASNDIETTTYIDNIPENGGYNRSSLIGKTTKEYVINSDKTGNQWINYKPNIGGNTEIKIVKVSTVAGANFNPTWKNKMQKVETIEVNVL